MEESKNIMKIFFFFFQKIVSAKNITEQHWEKHQMTVQNSLELNFTVSGLMTF